MKKAIVTIAIGEKHQAILSKTKEYINAYAAKVGADFIIYNESVGLVVPHYEKIIRVKNLLKDYDRVCWMDCDILVNPNSPDIFETVKENEFGIFNEAPWIDRSADVEQWKQLTGFSGFPKNTYYNTGVMVASKMHADIFTLPDILVNHYGDQTYLNQKIILSGHKVNSLDHRWNRMSCTWLKGQDPYDSYFIHFAGMNPPEGLPRFIEERWNEWKQHDFKGGSQIFVVCGGGMGNQVATLPTVEEIIRMHPDAKIGIRSVYDDVFRHLESSNVEVIGVSSDKELELEEKRLSAYNFARVINTQGNLPINMTEMNSVDYHSIVTLGRQLEDRRIRIPCKPCGVTLPENTVVIHAGRNGWASKDVPRALYEEVAMKLSRDFPIAIIGKSDFSKHGDGYGAYFLECAKYNFLDAPLLETCDVIRQGAFLLTNDSLPVHLAGAFDNWIGLISIAKHPSLIFPYRDSIDRDVKKEIAFTGKKGANRWDLVKRKSFYFPGEGEPPMGDFIEGMKWPDAEEIAGTIRYILYDV